mmetsp:Transcript_6367/g.17349  ORF Transcript_6367/g.17349 Transcript_6367/m.17349 type:complete len:97 (-) Transcript_6367:127-417(-)
MEQQQAKAPKGSEVAEVRPQWHGAQAQDLKGMPQPPGRAAAGASAGGQPLSGWASLATGGASSAPAARVACASCEREGTRTMVRPGQPCWLCGHKP